MQEAAVPAQGVRNERRRFDVGSPIAWYHLFCRSERSQDESLISVVDGDVQAIRGRQRADDDQDEALESVG
jgi:hypothetical protein